MTDVVRVVLLRPDPAPPAAGLLDALEAERAGRYRHVVDRDRFVAGVVATKELVGAVTGVAPAEVALDRTCEECGSRAHGRPRLRRPPGHRDLHVSVTHGGAWVAVAVASRPVGVDLEPVTPDVVEVGPVVLTDREAGATTKVAEADRPAALTRLWVRKEAVLKAVGAGLRVPPDTVDVSDRAVVVAAPHDRALEVEDLALADGYAAAVAVAVGSTPWRVEVAGP